MGQPHTHGSWRVKPGREDDFVAAWREMASWSNDQFGEVGGARLLQDQKDPTRFYSVGSWPSNEAIEAWRAHPEFRQHIAAIEDLIESFTIDTLELRAEVGEFCAVAA
jgi:heme-degrading monooxygenase HmoA